jgi:ribosomal protein S1
MTQYASMDELLAKTGKALKVLKYGDVVEGRVVSIARNQVLVDLKAKSEGLVSSRELTENPALYKNLKVGDTVLASVLQPENDRGYVVLSLKKAASEYRWRELSEIFEQGGTLAVRVTEFNKGGFLVDAGIPGFIPLTHLDKARVNDSAGPEKLIGQTIDVKIIEMDRALNRLVFSEKEAKSNMTSKKRVEILSSFKPGDHLEGEVSAILPFGIFVELSGVEGLCHISEISWEKVDDPSLLYKVGQKVKVKVLEVDPAQNKLALSIKALLSNPWQEVAKKYKVGERITGTVSKVVPFGAFVLLEPGLEGLIHVSETIGPLKVGEKVEAEIITVEPDKQKLGLSVRKLKEVMVTYK